MALPGRGRRLRRRGRLRGERPRARCGPPAGRGRSRPGRGAKRPPLPRITATRRRRRSPTRAARFAFKVSGQARLPVPARRRRLEDAVARRCRLPRPRASARTASRSAPCVGRRRGRPASYTGRSSNRSRSSVEPQPSALAPLYPGRAAGGAPGDPHQPELGTDLGHRPEPRPSAADPPGCATATTSS